MSPSSAAFFEEKYRASADPWDFAHSPYEQSRYERIVASLGGRRFQRALEPGCSVGALSEKLAHVCARVDAFDFAPSAVARAQERCASLPNVHLSCAALTPRLAFERYDLIVLSEVGYYFAPHAWSRLVTRLVRKMKPGATLLAAHWLGTSADHRMTGDEVHEELASRTELNNTVHERPSLFRLDLWTRA